MLSLDGAVWKFSLYRRLLHNNRDDLLQFAYNQPSKKQHRDDYKEYLKLAIIFLGVTVPNFSFKRPRATHYARSLNGENTFLPENMNVRKQKNVLNQNDIELVKTVSFFAEQVYLKPWFTACNAPSATGQI